MAIALRQSAANSTPFNSHSVRVSLGSATQQGSLVLVIASAVLNSDHTIFSADPSGFTRAVIRQRDDVSMAVWFRQNAPPLSSVTVSARHESLAVRVIEFTGVAQANALDRIAIGDAQSSSVSTGTTGTTAQADELLVGAILSQHASTTQSGFTGGLAKLYENVTSSFDDEDNERHRVTVHSGVTSSTGSFGLGARLSSSRDWVAVLLAFRGGSLGPLRMSSKNAPPMIRFGGRGSLTVFGPLVSRNAPAMIRFGGRGWIGPFEYQFLLGGRTGLLIGKGTEYRVESIEGLGGWEVRASDSPFPRGDGDQRGIDLQGARQVLMRVNFDGSPLDLEAGMQRLLAALRPRRDSDQDMYFRLPGMPLQVLRCRPMSLTREISAERLILASQPFGLRAADPRIYSARSRQVVVPVTEGGGSVVTAVAATNAGNGNAYPIIRITGAPDVEVTSVQLVNVTANVAFEVSTLLPPRGQLVGDMPALVTSEPRSKITVDGQARYAAWLPPRDPFYIAPDPVAPGGVNALYLRTTPEGAGVTCVLEYRDTWAG